MSITRHFYSAHHFAYSQCVGSMDDQDLRIHVLSFQMESDGMPYVREILDFRQLRRVDKLTVQGMIKICDLERERSKDRDFRLAIVVGKPLIEQIARIYAQVIRTDNLKVKVFNSGVDDALAWLGYGRPLILRLNRFMDKHRMVL